MAKILGRFLLILFLVLPTAVVFLDQGKGGNLAFAQDAMEGEDDDATVETETGTEEDGGEETDAVTTEKEEETEEEDETIKPSPDADTFVLFTKPANPLELPAGKQVHILVGFTNKGYAEFTIENMEASFRYPQDYNFFLQNFTELTFNGVVGPKRQGTFEYIFIPNEALSSRPFGLTVLLNYKDEVGNVFQNAVFNETIQVIEPDEGLDGETFFLYVFLVAIIVLLLVGAQQLLSNYGRKRLSKPRQPVEMGTQNAEVDYDWIPKETLYGLNKASKRSPRQSPRQRRNLRSKGSGDE